MLGARLRAPVFVRVCREAEHECLLDLLQDAGMVISLDRCDISRMAIRKEEQEGTDDDHDDDDDDDGDSFACVCLSVG